MRLKPYGYHIPLNKKSIVFGDETPQIVKDMEKKFLLSEFERERAPFCIDTISDEEKFSRYDIYTMTGCRVLDMPIKFPKSPDIRVPFELKQFDDTIEKIITFEHSINPNFVDDCYAYLTVDQSFVSPRAPHRNKNPHINSSFDHYQASLGGYVSRSYIASDISPKKFFKQPFFIGIVPFNIIKDGRQDSLSQRFIQQKEEVKAAPSLPYAIMAYNAFCVHCDDTLPYASFRTMLRLTIDSYCYQRTMNTHNPMFQYSWS